MKNFYTKNRIKLLILIFLLFFYYVRNRYIEYRDYCRNKEMDYYRQVYVMELYNAMKEKIEGTSYNKPAPLKMQNFRLAIYYAVRGEDDSALIYFYKGMDKKEKFEEVIESILLKIYVPRHIKSFPIEEKLKFIKEGRYEAKVRGLYVLVVDSYLLEGFVLKEEIDSFFPGIIDTTLKYAKYPFDSVVIRNSVLNLIKPEDFWKYFELDRKLRESSLKRRPCPF